MSYRLWPWCRLWLWLLFVLIHLYIIIDICLNILLNCASDVILFLLRRIQFYFDFFLDIKKVGFCYNPLFSYKYFSDYNVLPLFICYDVGRRPAPLYN